MAAQQGLTGEQVEKQFFEKTRPSSILKRFIAPEEVAALVVFVASPLASATNGAALRVDGGVVRSIVWRDLSSGFSLGFSLELSNDKNEGGENG